MLSALVTSESVKLIFKWASERLKNIDLKLSSSEKDIETALSQHIKAVKNWSSEINFKDLKTSKSTQSVYIELDLLLYPRRIRISEEEVISSISLSELLNREKKHIAILGQPGAGKTTSMKHVCQSILYDDNFFPNTFRYPILIKLREFNKPSNTQHTAGIIIEYLFNALGLKIAAPETKEKAILNNLKEKLVCDILDKINALLIIEGLDEITFKKHKAIIMDELPKLANQLEQAKMVITSRTADYTYSLENVAEFEFCTLNDQQIKEFSLKWLGNRDEADNFFNDIKKSPFYDTTIRPLTIAHLCAIYERVGRIPEKPKTVYKKIINLLLDDWDEQRNILRQSKYASFETDRKFDFLAALAFYLTTNSRKTIFDKQALLNIYQKIHSDFDLDLREASNVVQEIESHTGLFLECGFEMYEFAHKSLQEYLSAEYIVKLPIIPNDKRIVEMLPNELAISVSISSNPSIYFTEMVFNRFTHVKLTLEYMQTFINRLILEKPDFNNDENVGIAALLLYSLYLNTYIEEDTKSQLSLFTIDDLTEAFEIFIDNIFKRNSKQAILETYKIEDSYESTNGTKILTLSLKLGAGSYPHTLLCRESFL